MHEIASGLLSKHTEQLDYLHLANKFGFEFAWGEMSDLNKENKTITLKPKLTNDGEVIIPERKIAYDNLIIAVGSTSNYC